MSYNNMFEIDMDMCPLWNSKYPYIVSENMVTSVSIPINEIKDNGFIHCKPLSNFSCVLPNPSLKKLNIIAYMNGNISVRDICDKVLSEIDDVKEDAVIKEIYELYKNGFLVFLKN